MTSPRHPEEVADPGLQSERTYLAWQRTGLGFLGVGALFVHAAGGITRPVGDVPGFLSMAVGAVVLARGLLRYRLAAAAAAGARSVAAPGTLAAIAAAASVLSLAGLVVLVLLP